MPNFKTVVGIGLGNIAVGAIGQNNMLNLSIFGNCVNESSRLCNFVKTIDSKILISETYYEALRQSNGLRNHKFRNIGHIKLRGRSAASRVYENYDVYDAEKQSQIETSNALIQQAIQCYEASDYKDCLNHLEKAEKIFPNDPLARYYKELAYHALQNQPTKTAA